MSQESAASADADFVSSHQALCLEKMPQAVVSRGGSSSAQTKAADALIGRGMELDELVFGHRVRCRHWLSLAGKD